MENKLLEVINQSGLEKTKSDTLLENFSNFYEIASEWQAKANQIIVNDVSNVAEMKLAREGRLFLKDKRISIEKTRKQLKESSLREGQAIDSIAKMLTNLIVPIEENLELKEKFKEFEEKRVKDALRQSRQDEVNEYREFVPHNIDLADLTDIAFNTIKAGAKAQYDAKLEEQRKFEEEKVNAIKVSALDYERRNELRDNDLWFFVDADTKMMNFGTMTDKYYNGLFADLQKRKQDAINEQERIRNEYEKARKEKEELEKKMMQERNKAEKEKKLAEQEREKLKAELDKKEKEQREAERQKQLEEEKARKEAQKLAKAPVKKQLKAWVESFDIADCPLHEQIAVDIIVKFEAFKQWSLKQIDNL